MRDSRCENNVITFWRKNTTNISHPALPHNLIEQSTMSDSENTNYIEDDSEDSFHPDEESSSNDSDEPSASSKRPKNSRKRSSLSIFTSTPRNSASHRLSKTVSRNTMLVMLHV